MNFHHAGWPSKPVEELLLLSFVDMTGGVLVCLAGHHSEYSKDLGLSLICEGQRVWPACQSRKFVSGLDSSSLAEISTAGESGSSEV